MKRIKIYPNNRPGPKFEARDIDHVPFNKRRWEIENSAAHLEMVDCPDGGADNSGWLSIFLAETTQAKPNGPFQTRTITFELHGAERTALLDMLKGSAK